MGEEDDKRINGSGVLEDGNAIGDVGSSDSGANLGDEIDSKHTTGEETVDETDSGENHRGDGEAQGLQGRAISALPGGCNVFYGTYIDNYNGSTRRRYYLDSYGRLILSQTSSRVNTPSGVSCLTEMPASHNRDMGIIAAEAAAAIAIWLAVKFVIGRIIK